ncbi:MAG: hypothetical protein IGQ45_03740 [Cyanobacterium sp. T60_A2020_053]|nr:hypothetical protein [Cyanobacterium sp. T60_A2020_053]
MRQRPSPRRTELELFPFLSVLACTIGTLILLIIVISTETLESSSQVTIVAENQDGQNLSKTPRYIECREDGVIIYPSEIFVSENELTGRTSPLIQLIDEVEENRDQEYVIVIVRPKGIEVFYQVRDVIEERDIDIGYEPIEEGLQLQLQSEQ